MKHLTAGALVDLARGIANADEKAADNEHLEAGCQACATALELWKTLAWRAQREAAFDPPDGAVRNVEAFFASHRPRYTPSNVETAAQVIYDSLAAPLPAGIRSTPGSPRQLLYQVGDFVVDLRLDADPDTHLVFLVGQVLHQAEALECVRDIPVKLVKNRNTVTETRTNSFGEFHLEYVFDAGHRLCVELNGDQVVTIDSDGLKVPTGNEHRG